MLSADIRAPLRDFELAMAFSVSPGSCLALAGPSGAGKTSALRAVAGLLRPLAGRIACGTQTWLETGAGRDVAPERRGCALMFQDYALFPNMSAWRNVAYGMRGVPARERRSRAHALLERFGVAHLADAAPAGLSGGERQRVALARALAVEPAVLLLDEPLSALDARSAESAQRELAEVLRDSTAPSILVTHDFAQAGLLADSVAVIDRGRIAQLGTASELAAAPATPFVAELTGASVLRGRAVRRGPGICDVLLGGGARIAAVGDLSGAVAVVVRPWDVTIEPAERVESGSSARNHLRARVTGVAALGGRVRVALALPEPLAAEVTTEAAAGLGLRPGLEVTATLKATAAQVVADQAAGGQSIERTRSGTDE